MIVKVLSTSSRHPPPLLIVLIPSLKMMTMTTKIMKKKVKKKTTSMTKKTLTTTNRLDLKKHPPEPHLRHRSQELVMVAPSDNPLNMSRLLIISLEILSLRIQIAPLTLLDKGPETEEDKHRERQIRLLNVTIKSHLTMLGHPLLKRIPVHLRHSTLLITRRKMVNNQKWIISRMI